MKKLWLLTLMAMLLGLTACNTDKNNSTPETKQEEAALPEETALPEGTEEQDLEETEPQEEPAEVYDLTILKQMCRVLNDFDEQTVMDESFFQDFLFYSYTGASSDNAELTQVYREDLGFEETVVKVSLQDAQAYTKLILGKDLPDFKPSFADMEEGQTSFYYEDGYYYIGVSDFPDYQYTFMDFTNHDEGSDPYAVVTYSMDFEDESNVGTIIFTIAPEDNENGFIIRSKTTEFYQ